MNLEDRLVQALLIRTMSVREGVTIKEEGIVLTGDSLTLIPS